MSKRSTQRIAVVISLCSIFAVIGVFFGLRQLNAQGASPGGMMMPMMPGMPGMTGMGGSQSSSPVTETAPTAPLVSINSVVRGIQTKNIKNWDGTVTSMLRFKYQLSPKQTLTVYLPKSLTTEKRTKNGWEALFQAFAMDKEAIVDAEIKNNPTPNQSSSGVSVGSTGMMGGGMMMPGMPGMPGMGGGASMPMLPPMPGR